MTQIYGDYSVTPSDASSQINGSTNPPYMELHNICMGINIQGTDTEIDIWANRTLTNRPVQWVYCFQIEEPTTCKLS